MTVFVTGSLYDFDLKDEGIKIKIYLKLSALGNKAEYGVSLAKHSVGVP